MMVRLAKAIAILFLALALPAPLLAGVIEADEAFKTGRYEEALRQYQPLAEQGDAWSQYQIGMMYFSGNGVKKDRAVSADWFRKAAEQGNIKAQVNLAWMYGQGEGVAKDDTAATQWYRKAAEQGDARAQFSLGLRLADGLGAERNLDQAMLWLRKAADQGIGPASRAFDQVKEIKDKEIEMQERQKKP